jgi:hypothetical protein
MVFNQLDNLIKLEQNKMTYLVKMDNRVLVKWDILCYLICKDSYKLG